MGTDTSDGTIKLKDIWKNDPGRGMTALDVLDVDFDLNKLTPLFSKMIHQMERIAKTIGKNGVSSFSTPLWDSTDVQEIAQLYYTILVAVLWVTIETKAW